MISTEQVLKDIQNQSHGKIDKIVQCPMTLGPDFVKKNACVVQIFEKTAEGHRESVFYLGYVGTEIAPGVRESYAKEIARFRKSPETEFMLSDGIIETAMFTDVGLIVEVDYWGTRKQLEPYQFSWVPLGEWSRL